MLKKLPLVLMALIMGGILAASHVFALGIGDITAKSALNQRLDAEIELLSSIEGELDDLTVRLASQDAFDRIGLERPALLTSIQFEIATRPDGTPIIKLSTPDSIREPFLDFLVEINWPKGRVLREYTVLLEPPVSIAAQSQPLAPGSSAVPVPYAGETDPVFPDSPVFANDAQPAATSSPDAEAPYDGLPSEPSAESSAESSYEASYDSDTYGPIASQETLWSIAALVRSGDASIQQMVLALFDNNPEAFIDGDIHRVKKGAVLRIPDSGTVATRSRIDAAAEIRQHNARLGITPEVSESAGIPDAASIAASTIPSDSAVQRDELNLLTPDNASSAGTGSASEDVAALKRELALAAETVSSQRLENEELKSRVRELEAAVEEVDKLRRLFEIQNEEMAKLQSQISGDDTVPDAAAVPPEETGEVVAPAPESDITEAAEPIVETAKSEESDSAVAAESAVPEPVESASLPPPVSQEPFDVFMGYVNQVVDDPMLLAIGGGVLLVLLALTGLIMRRRKAAAFDKADVTDRKAHQTETKSSGKSLFAGLAASFAGFKDRVPFLRKSGSEDVDFQDEDITENEDITQHHSSSRGGGVQVDEMSGGDQPNLSDMIFEEDEASASSDSFNAIVEDPASEPASDELNALEEVDIYEAFGDFEQAAEIVKQAIADQPGNNQFKLRLFKVYQSGSMSDEYSRDAVAYQSEMQGSPEWNEVEAMGKEFVPDCPVWAGSSAAEASVDEPPAASADEAMDVDDMGEASALEGFDAGMDFDSPDPDMADLDTADEEVQSDTPAEQELSGGDERGNTLEFDLSDLNFDSADDKPEQSESEPEPEQPPADNELEFELADEEPEPVEESSDSDADISMELDGNNEQTPESGVDQQFESTVQLDADAASGLEMLEVEETEAVLEDLGASLADESGDSTESESESDLSMGIDLSDFNFDVDESGQSGALPVLEDGEPDASDSASDALSEVPDEVATKLDLARAYIDMGDADGAKGILDEVVSEGSEVQQQEAQELMKNI